MDLRLRLEELAERLGSGQGRASKGPRPAPGRFWSDEDWRGLRELFTRDVTGHGLREFHYETRDAYRFFVRELDFAGLETHPWYKRYPLMAWRIFLAMAYRLSPARRILFAVGVPLLAIGWLREVLFGQWTLTDPFGWVLLGATLLFVLLAMELKDKLALKGDLEVARQIQFGLLPFEPYRMAGVTIEAAMRPANTVGGDYFDIVDLGAGRIGVALGDVAGKGMPAALLMALLQGSLRTLVTAGLRGGDLMEALNAHLHAHLPRNRLVTLFYGELDAAGGELSYVNGGHNPPFLIRAAGGFERLEPTAVALGVLAVQRCTPVLAHLDPGDRLFLYTDGVTEAFDRAETEYGEERLRQFLAGHRSLPGARLMEALLSDVIVFCGSERPRDDMTLMMVERTASPTDPIGDIPKPLATSPSPVAGG
jgi:sigma-B regulation protein RsbU (phosphoserine phosphatase)